MYSRHTRCCCTTQWSASCRRQMLAQRRVPPGRRKALPVAYSVERPTWGPNTKPAFTTRRWEGENRILLPEVPALCGLRHRWCWEARPRPHLPTWSFAKVPRPQLSPEENARLLCVYLRPWTLDPSESTRNNPLLSILGKCDCIADMTPLWMKLPSPADAAVAAPPSTS